MASKLYVGGLSYSTTSDSLRQYFAQRGTVESATVITDRMSGDSRRFGFVEMSTEAEAQAAIAKLNDQSFEGRKLMVGTRGRNPGRHRPPASGVCFRRDPERRSSLGEASREDAEQTAQEAPTLTLLVPTRLFGQDLPERGRVLVFQAREHFPDGC